MKTKHVVAVVLVCSLMLLRAIVFAQWPSYELERERGSWCDEIWFKIAIGADAQMVELLSHEVDACGEPSAAVTVKTADAGIPRHEDIGRLRDAGYTLSSTGGFDMSFYAINCRAAKAPLDDSTFRTALAYCINKDEILGDLYGPMVMPLYNFVPPAQAFWYDTTVPPTFPAYSLTTAIATLMGGGYTPVLKGPGGPVPGNIDHWNMPSPPYPHDTPVRDLEQAVPVESTLGMYMSQWIEMDMHSIGLPIYHTPMPFNYIVYDQWLTPPYLRWDITVGIGLSLSQNPFLYEMFDGASIPFWNIWGINDPAVNMWTSALKTTLTPIVAQTNAYAAEAALVTAMPIIPIMSSNRYSACTGPYDGQPGVLGWVEMEGHGGYNLWSALYSRREDTNGEPYPHNIWVMGEDAQKLNPLTSDTVYEWQLLSLVYSTLLQKNPYTHELMPWCVTDYPEIQSWSGTHREVSPGVWVYDPSPVGSPGAVTGEYMRWTLRDDMTWHDGTPVTSADVEFCLDLLVNQNNERYDSIQRVIHDVEVIDEFTVDVYLTARYLWAENDISHIALLAPRHIWKPYIAGDNGILWDPDDRDHRFWSGVDWTNIHGYSAPTINTVSGTVQLTHLQGNGPFVFPRGGWVPNEYIRLIRWYDPSTETCWHYTRILRGDNNFDGYVDTLDLNKPKYAFGSMPEMPGWENLTGGLKADMANPAALIDGRDVAKVYDDWDLYWYPTSTLP